MTYKLNNKEYNFDKEINFREILKMEKCGVSFTKLEDEPFNQAIGMVSYVTGLDKAKTLKEIDEHFENGGSFDDIIAFLNVLVNCDFFKKVGAKK